MGPQDEEDEEMLGQVQVKLDRMGSLLGEFANCPGKKESYCWDGHVERPIKPLQPVVVVVDENSLKFNFCCHFIDHLQLRRKTSRRNQ